MSSCTDINNIPDGSTGESRGTIQPRHEKTCEPVPQRIANTGKRTLPDERLPPEIMGLIFRRCLDGENINLPRDPVRYDTVEFPWVLRQVCSRWRDIVMSDPTIWSSLTILYEDVRNKEALTRRVEEFILPWTKHGWISLTCSNIEPEHGDYTGLSGAITTLIIPNLARFRHLTLSMTREELEPLITSSPGLMKSLESMELVFTWIDDIPQEYFDFHCHSMTAFEEAPMLRKVHLSSHRFCQFKGTQPLTLPWSQLTDLKISINLPYPAVVAFLPHCTQLVDCFISVGNWDDHEDEGAFPKNITLPQLRSITLCSAYGGTYACPNLLRLLILPVLKRFILYLHDEISMQDILRALINRSRCQLERFTMISSFGDALTDLATLLQEMPSLQRLIVPRDYILPESAITRMITGELGPALETIHCQVASLPLMLQLLESRKEGRSPGAPESYRGIRCFALWGQSMFECQCGNF